MCVYLAVPISRNFRRLMGVKCTANSAKKVLKVIDTDGSGAIDIDEYQHRETAACFIPSHLELLRSA